MGRTQPPDHPLDPLSAAEIAATTDVVRAHTEFATLSADTRFITMELAEPDKAAVLAWGAGGARPERIADVVMLDRGSEASVEAVRLARLGVGDQLAGSHRHSADGGGR